MTSKLSTKFFTFRPSHTQCRLFSSTFKSEDLRIEVPRQLKVKPPVNDLIFGKHFSDHMFKVSYNEKDGWSKPIICQLQNFEVHPASKVLHYAQELFEGMKAYRGVDNKIRMFRPMHNMSRMLLSARMSSLPEFDPNELLKCMVKLVQLDQDWVPNAPTSSLYMRPTMIGTEASLGVASSTEAELFVICSPTGPYFSSGLAPINLLADPKFVRAWPGGCGFVKMGSNYAPTLHVGKVARQNKCHQALWLYGPDHEITEAGTMNIFVVFKKDDGRLELVTPPLESGLILPGVTRRSVVELAQELDEFDVVERKVTLQEVLDCANNGTLVEMFGTGTAAIINHVGNILYNDVFHSIPVPEPGQSVAKRVIDKLSDIYYGKVKHSWGVPIEDPIVKLIKEEQKISDEDDQIMDVRMS